MTSIYILTAMDTSSLMTVLYTKQANYESGLRILRIDSETYELSQVAYFDVFPSRTTSEFAGSWSVYPYFKSGKL